MVYKMSRKLYRHLAEDHKGEDGITIKGLGSKKNVIAYINSTWGLLHQVTDIQID